MPTTSSGEMTNATVTGAAIAGYELSEAVAAAMVTDAALHTIAARATDRISLADYTGADVIYERNRRRNLFAVINGGEFPASWLARDNIIACDPASVGYSGSNAGVGLVPAAGPAFAHMIEDGNPADVGMGETFNAPPVSAGVMPSEGTYVAGISSGTARPPQTTARCCSAGSGSRPGQATPLAPTGFRCSGRRPERKDKRIGLRHFEIQLAHPMIRR